LLGCHRSPDNCGGGGGNRAGRESSDLLSKLGDSFGQAEDFVLHFLVALPDILDARDLDIGAVC